MSYAGQETELQNAAAYYVELGTNSDLREPHRIPQQFVRGLFEKEAPALPPTPVIAFINSRSGGRAGPQLSASLTRALGATQVFDLGMHRPDKVLKKLWENFEEGSSVDAEHLRNHLRVLTAGGDGTVAWVLQTIARLDLEPPPAVAVIPLGTGNDLSRSFGWGPAFSKSWINGHRALHKTLGRIAQATPAPLDRWRVCMTAPTPQFFTGKRPYGFAAVEAATEGCSYAAEAWNYISVGMDAKAAEGFHRLRDEKPGLAFSRAANQFWYGWFSCSSGWFCGAEPLSRTLKVEVLQGGQWEDLEISSAVRALVLLNLQSYGGGRNLWGKHGTETEAQGFSQPSNCDGLLELVAFKSGYHAGAVMAGGMHAARLAQSAGVRMHVRGTEGADKGEEGVEFAYMQLDGEPWKQKVPGKKAPEGEALQVEVTYQGQSRMLLAPGSKGSASPVVTADKAIGTSSHQAATNKGSAQEGRAEGGSDGASMGLSQLPHRIGAAVSMPHVTLTTPDAARGGVPIPPAPAQNLPDFQHSGAAPRPESPMDEETLSALASTSRTQGLRAKNASPVAAPVLRAPPAAAPASSEGAASADEGHTAPPADGGGGGGPPKTPPLPLIECVGAVGDSAASTQPPALPLGFPDKPPTPRDTAHSP